MSEFNELLKTPLYRAMNRPSLFMGGDRELTLSTLLFGFTFVFVSLKPLIILITVLMVSAVITMLRIMAKADPQMKDVYMRHRKYKAHYRPNSTPFAKFKEKR